MGELVSMVSVKEYTTFSVSDFTGNTPHNHRSILHDLCALLGSKVSVILCYANFTSCHYDAKGK